MPALTAGKATPAVKLPLVQGGEFNLQEALRRGPVLLAFFKVSCPVCQLAFPFLERIHQRAGGKAPVVGVSQDDAKETAAFLREYGITFPVALDDTRTYPVSNAYGLTNVPTLFHVEQSGRIGLTSVGWSRADVEEVGRRLAKAGGILEFHIFKSREDVPEWKAG